MWAEGGKMKEWRKKKLNKLKQRLSNYETFEREVKDLTSDMAELSWIVCLTSQLTIFQSYMWRHIDVQADWRRSMTYGRAPNAIDIS